MTNPGRGRGWWEVMLRHHVLSFQGWKEEGVWVVGHFCGYHYQSVSTIINFTTLGCLIFGEDDQREAAFVLCGLHHLWWPLGIHIQRILPAFLLFSFLLGSFSSSAWDNNLHERHAWTPRNYIRERSWAVNMILKWHESEYSKRHEAGYMDRPFAYKTSETTVDLLNWRNPQLFVWGT